MCLTRDAPKKDRYFLESHVAVFEALQSTSWGLERNKGIHQQSKLLASPLIARLVVLYVTPFKEFRL